MTLIWHNDGGGNGGARARGNRADYWAAYVAIARGFEARIQRDGEPLEAAGTYKDVIAARRKCEELEDASNRDAQK